MSNNIAFNVKRKDSISKMFLSTAISMIFIELAGVIATLIDGIVASKCIGVDTYSGISLVSPFTSIVLTFASFLSTGCSVSCSQLVGFGNKKEANELFNITAFLGVVFAILVLLICIVAPTPLLQICGVNLNKYPELQPHIYGYLHGYALCLPALVLIQIIGPIIVMDSGKRFFFGSSIVLCITDIIGDFLNAFVFHGGAFGMGLATAIGLYLQFIILLVHFSRSKGFFKFSLKALRFTNLSKLMVNGSPAFVKKIASAIRDIVMNYINVMFAVTAAAVAARGIQNDMLIFLFCIPTGLGRTLITMVGVYYSANDKKGLRDLYSYAFKIGMILTGIAGVLSFIAAPFVASFYANDPEVIRLAVLSIRWMSVNLFIDTFVVLMLHFLQGIGNMKVANIVSFAERLIFPVITGFVMGFFWGSEGILASVTIANLLLLIAFVIAATIQKKRIPKSVDDLMFLPDDFGGTEVENLYCKITSMKGVIAASQLTYDFCLENKTNKRTAYLMSLFVEEMGSNVVRHGVLKYNESFDVRLFVSEDTICFSLTDLSNQFDPVDYYNLANDKETDRHMGIKLVNKMAKEVKYYNTFNSNNLLVYLEKESVGGEK